MAAYRLRSFSESESWNIRIECSISGLYVMGGRPLRGLDRPYYRYTIPTGNREVIESAIPFKVVRGRLRNPPRTTDEYLLTLEGQGLTETVARLRAFAPLI